MPKAKNAKPPPRVTASPLGQQMDSNKSTDTRLTNSQAYTTSDSSASNYGCSSAQGVPGHRTSSNPPVVLSSSHGDRSDLTSISPFAQEGHDESLHPCRT